ncbi:MAG: acetyl-CoA carboxylase carboxyltransferase subunit alpha [Calditrichaeota bacterium]|nr:acetyl-CoA carboxylase carboxyltransferase subunit alpha [Calditrichota bacterium]
MKRTFRVVLDFEKPVVELQKKIAEMEQLAKETGVNVSEDAKRLKKKADSLQKEIYAKLTPWQRVQLARHSDRPFTLDYIERIADDFTELHGDRYYADDAAMITGMARIEDFRVMLIGQQKGRDVKENLHRNFGMSNPEGYRKALRVMKLAAKFNMPIITFIDTPGAYPGIGAEERGQAEAIARNLLEMARLPVPVIITVIGEGASGGALGIGVGDVILMLENCWYSVISPEGCAAILWKDNAKAPQAAEIMKLTAPDLLELGVIDKVVKEPFGGAHWDWDAAADNLKKSLLTELKQLSKIAPDKLIEKRIQKYEKMGFWSE